MGLKSRSEPFGEPGHASGLDGVFPFALNARDEPFTAEETGEESSSKLDAQRDGRVV